MQATMSQPITIDAVFRLADELVQGTGKPSLLYALWGAILSPQKPIEMNCRQVAVLRSYVKRGLPTHDADELAAFILEKSGDGWVYRNHAEAIIRADALYRAGKLSHLEREPQTGREWIAWRKEIAMLYGMGWKTASFAALILWPFTSPFPPIDSHVSDMLGIMHEYTSGKLSRKSKPGYRRYRTHEREWRRTIASMGIGCVDVGHWFLWAQHQGQLVSHAGLNARIK